MKLLTPIFAVTLLMLGFSTTASATFYHPKPQKPHYCDNGDLCDNSQPYSTTLTTGDINNSGKYAYWSFDSIDVADLEIESAKLTVKSNASNWYGWGSDQLYAYTDNWWGVGLDYIGKLDDGYDVFSLSSSLFDEVINGLSLKAIFSKNSEDVFWSKLEVSGVYCPPISEVPLPAAVWLFGSGLMGFMAVRRRAKAQQA
jgi:hypothetical protein